MINNSKKLINKLSKQQDEFRRMAQEIATTKDRLWNLEVNKLKESGILSKLTWEYNSYFRHFEGPGFRSKESMDQNKISETLKMWMDNFKSTYKVKDEFIQLSKRDRILFPYPDKDTTEFTSKDKKTIGLGVEYIGDGDEEKLVFAIFAADWTDDFAHREGILDKLLLDFGKEWNINMEITE